MPQIGQASSPGYSGADGQGSWSGRLVGHYEAANPVKGTYFDCYLTVEIHSRFIVGAHVQAAESGALAVEMMKEIFGIHGSLSSSTQIERRQ